MTTPSPVTELYGHTVVFEGYQSAATPGTQYDGSEPSLNQCPICGGSAQWGAESVQPDNRVDIPCTCAVHGEVEIIYRIEDDAEEEVP